MAEQKQDIYALVKEYFFYKWTGLLKDKNLGELENMYEFAVLFATFSNEFRRGGKEAVGYFEEFVKKNPTCKILDDVIFVSDDSTLISWAGFYEFEVDDGDKRTIQHAGFTFIFKYNAITEKITLLHHHSSPR